MTTVVADGHKLTRVCDRVVYAQAGDCHQYFTVFNGRVTACNGSGWVQSPGPTWVSERVEQSVARMLR